MLGGPQPRQSTVARDPAKLVPPAPDSTGTSAPSAREVIAIEQLRKLAAEWQTPALELSTATWPPPEGHARRVWETYNDLIVKGTPTKRAAAQAFKTAFGDAWPTAATPELPVLLLRPKKSVPSDA
jgi:hypothetical protein